MNERERERGDEREDEQQRRVRERKGGWGAITRRWVWGGESFTTVGH